MGETRLVRSKKQAVVPTEIIVDAGREEGLIWDPDGKTWYCPDCESPNERHKKDCHVCNFSRKE